MVFNFTCVSIVFQSSSRKLKWTSVNYQSLLYSSNTEKSVKLVSRKYICSEWEEVFSID